MSGTSIMLRCFLDGPLNSILRISLLKLGPVGRG